MFKRSVHPGEILKDELEEFGVSQAAFARQIDVPPNRVSQIIAGKRSVTGDTALRFGHWFGVEPQFWLNLQSQFDLGYGGTQKWGRNRGPAQGGPGIAEGREGDRRPPQHQQRIGSPPAHTSRASARAAPPPPLNLQTGFRLGGRNDGKRSGKGGEGDGRPPQHQQRISPPAHTSTGSARAAPLTPRNRIPGPEPG